MKSSRLSFCTMVKLSTNTVEVIVDSGIEIDIDMVSEYHKWIRTNMESPTFLLINKKNAYTYTFEAQLEIGLLPEIKAMGVISYNHFTTVATQALAEVQRKSKWNIRIFGTRELAIEWLCHEEKESKMCS